MNERELVEFISRSDRTLVKEYLESLKGKIEIINTRIERILLLLFLSLITYFLIQDASISNSNLRIPEPYTGEETGAAGTHNKDNSKCLISGTFSALPPARAAVSTAIK